MKAIMVMYDSLNREMLESYGCNWTKTPNFKRFLEKNKIILRKIKKNHYQNENLSF